MNWARLLLLGNVGQQIDIHDILVKTGVLSGEVAHQIAQAVDASSGN